MSLLRCGQCVIGGGVCHIRSPDRLIGVRHHVPQLSARLHRHTDECKVPPFITGQNSPCMGEIALWQATAPSAKLTSSNSKTC